MSQEPMLQVVKFQVKAVSRIGAAYLKTWSFDVADVVMARKSTASPSEGYRSKFSKPMTLRLYRIPVSVSLICLQRSHIPQTVQGSTHEHIAEMIVWGGLRSNVIVIPSIMPLFSNTLPTVLEKSQLILGKPFQEIEEMLSSGLEPATPSRLVLTYGL